MNFSPNKEQQRYIEYLNAKRGDPLYKNVIVLSASGGKGKTAATDYYLETTEKRVQLLSIAAIAGAQYKSTKSSTFHSFVGLTPKHIGDINWLGIAEKNKNRPNWLIARMVDQIIIDEALSMLPAHFLDGLNVYLKSVRSKPNEPFGGCQIVLIGDPYQIEPVITPEEKKLLERKYGSNFYIWNSDVLKSASTNKVLVELTHNFRQSNDPEFATFLDDRCRIGKVTIEDIEMLNERVTEDMRETGIPESNYVVACNTNRSADKINTIKLKNNPNPAIKLDAQVLYHCGDFKAKRQDLLNPQQEFEPDSGNYQKGEEGRFKVHLKNVMPEHKGTIIYVGKKQYKVQKTNGTVITCEHRKPVDVLHNKTRAAMSLTLKIGCKVMFNINDTTDKRYMNGTIGTIESFDEDSATLKVRVSEERIISVSRVEFEYNEFGFNENNQPELVTKASIYQFPLQLAYALTIHKLQGTTQKHLFYYNIDRWFASGMMYVLLSRVKELDGLYLHQKVKINQFKVSDLVENWQNIFRDQIFGLLPESVSQNEENNGETNNQAA